MSEYGDLLADLRRDLLLDATTDLQPGSLLAALIDKNGHSSFLQLLSAQQLQIAFGGVTIGAGGTVVATHGLGRVPQAIVATYAGATPPNTALYASTFTTTTFVLGGANWGAFWIAIG